VFCCAQLLTVVKQSCRVPLLISRSYRLIPDQENRGLLFGYKQYRDDPVEKHYKLCYINDAALYMWSSYAFIGMFNGGIVGATSLRLALFREDVFSLIQSFDAGHPLVLTVGACCFSTLLFSAVNMLRMRSITRLYYSKVDKKFCAVLHNWMLRKRTLTFTADEVKPLSRQFVFNQLFSSRIIAGKPYLLSDEGFTDVKYLNILTGIIKDDE
jgi:hypothetical protein